MRSKKKNFIPILVLLLLGISLGYALLTQDLTINGITKVKGNSWDIHFDNIQVNDDSVALSTGDVDADIDANDDTLVEYTITLNQPGDFYEFTVDAVNDGTVDGMIGEIISKLNNTVISTTNSLPSYLDYSITYEDDIPIAVNHLLEAGHTETYKVRVEFKRDIENDELPTTDQTNTFSFGINYVQRDSNAIAVPHPMTIYTINDFYEDDLNDEYDPNNYIVRIGQPIPSLVVQYNSVEDVVSALSTLANGTVLQTIYLKHTVVNGIVMESYVEFTMVDGISDGTYTLRGAGGDVCTFNDNYYTYMCEQKSLYYDDNVEILNRAFDVLNSPYCYYYDDPEYPYYGCFGDAFNAINDESGNVAVFMNDDSFGCSVQADSSSECWGTPKSDVIIRYSSSEKGDNTIDGWNLPMTLYETFDEARGSGLFALKHLIINRKATTADVVFMVTPEMVNANSSMSDGIYTLRGAGGTDCIESGDDYSCSANSSYYESNKSVLSAAFGSTNCIDNTTNYSCTGSDLSAIAYQSGTVSVSSFDFDQPYDPICYVKANGVYNCGIRYH